MLIVYKKIDGTIIDNQGTNSMFPGGIPNVDPLIDSLVANIGGETEDYGVFRLHDTEDSEVVKKTFTHEFTIQNGKIVFGVEKPVPVPELQPLTAFDELSNYVLDVDFRVVMLEMGV